MIEHVAIVIPARDAQAVIGDCLRSIAPEGEQHGASVYVVDDGSTDATLSVAADLGARVLRSDHKGPYAARNIGWRAAAADGAQTIAFTDVRCRARPGWLEALTAPLMDSTVAIAGGDIVVEAGGNPAQRCAALTQPYRTRVYLAHAFLPYVPTGNLATRTTVLEAVRGFREIGSGGDAAFCWDAQRADLGRVVEAPGATMSLVPRDSITELIEQARKYGAANAHLAAMFGFTVPAPSWVRVGAGLGRSLARIARHPVRSDSPAELLAAATWIEQVRAHRRAVKALSGR